MAGARGVGARGKSPRSYSSPIRRPKLSLLTVPPSTSEEMNQSWYSVYRPRCSARATVDRELGELQLRDHRPQHEPVVGEGDLSSDMVKYEKFAPTARDIEKKSQEGPKK